MGYLLEAGDTLKYPQMKLLKPDNPEVNLAVIDRKIYRYRSGKIYVSYLYDGLDGALVKEMHANIDDHLDNLIVIHGFEGTGKSHMAYHLAKLFNPDFDIRKNYIYEFSEFLSRVTDDLDSPPGTVYWLDEASNIASNRDWMHTDNKEFIKVLEMFRSRGWTLILCIPQLDRLDLYIRETRARYLIRTAVMSWDSDKRSSKKRGYFSLERVDFSNNYRSVKKVGFGEFPPIPEPDLSVYEKIKLESQTKKIQQLNAMKEAKMAGGRNEQLGKKFRKLVLEMSEMGCSYERMAEITGMSKDSMVQYAYKARKEREEEG